MLSFICNAKLRGTSNKSRKDDYCGDFDKRVRNKIAKWNRLDNWSDSDPFNQNKTLL